MAGLFLYIELKNFTISRVILLSGGFGIWVYRNIGISHQVILISLVLVCVGCFFIALDMAGF